MWGLCSSSSSRSRLSSSSSAAFLSIVCFLLFVGVPRWFPHGAVLLSDWSGPRLNPHACQSRAPITRHLACDVMCCWAWLQPAGTPPRSCWIMGLVGLLSFPFLEKRKDLMKLLAFTYTIGICLWVMSQEQCRQYIVMTNGQILSWNVA